MSSIPLNKSLSKVFANDTLLLKNNRDKYLKEVVEMSNTNNEYEIELLRKALSIIDVVEILYDVYDYLHKYSFFDEYRRKIEREAIIITYILTSNGISVEDIVETLLFNIFSIIGADVAADINDLPHDKIRRIKDIYDEKGVFLTKMEVPVTSPSKGKSDNVERNIKRKGEKEYKPLLFNLSYAIVGIVWVIAASSSIAVMLLQVISGSLEEFILLISGGIVVLLIIAARFILPLIQESYRVYHNIKGVADMRRSGCDIALIEIAIGNPEKRKTT